MKQAAVANGVALRVERRCHLLQGDGEIGRASRGHLLDFIEIHGNGEVLRRDPADPGSDYDEVLQFDREAVAFVGERLHVPLLPARLRGSVLGNGARNQNNDQRDQRECHDRVQVRIGCPGEIVAHDMPSISACCEFALIPKFSQPRGRFESCLPRVLRLLKASHFLALPHHWRPVCEPWIPPMRNCSGVLSVAPRRPPITPPISSAAGP